MHVSVLGMLRDVPGGDMLVICGSPLSLLSADLSTDSPKQGEIMLHCHWHIPSTRAGRGGGRGEHGVDSLEGAGDC